MSILMQTIGWPHRNVFQESCGKSVELISPEINLKFCPNSHVIWYELC